jgi:pimeloyl-ACP methyl ester carboxylesterase
VSATASFTSRDGTRIGYHRLGSGPGIILLHGGLQSSHSLRRLGAALADRFTVVVPDRRGRGLSGAFAPDYSMATEVDDLKQLVENTGSRYVFGLSSGALMALAAAPGLPAVERLMLYEPPLAIAGVPSPLAWVPRYEAELERGRLAAAMVSILKGTADREPMRYAPRSLTVPIFALALRARPDAGVDGGPPLRTLIPTVHYDAQLVTEMAGRLEDFRTLTTPTLLLGGTRSRDYLTAALNALESVLPNSHRVILEDAGHLAADNTGQPELVAAELVSFCHSSPGAYAVTRR